MAERIGIQQAAWFDIQVGWSPTESCFDQHNNGLMSSQTTVRFHRSPPQAFLNSSKCSRCSPANLPPTSPIIVNTKE